MLEKNRNEILKGKFDTKVKLEKFLKKKMEVLMSKLNAMKL